MTEQEQILGLLDALNDPPPAGVEPMAWMKERYPAMAGVFLAAEAAEVEA